MLPASPNPVRARSPLVIPPSALLGCITPTSNRTPYPPHPPRRIAQLLPACPAAYPAAKVRSTFPACRSRRRWQPRQAKEGCSVGAATPAMFLPCVDWCPSLQTCATLERESWKRRESTRNWPTYGGCTTLGEQRTTPADATWQTKVQRRRPQRLPEEEIRLQGTRSNAFSHAPVLMRTAPVHIHSRLERRFRTSRSGQSCLGDQILGKTDWIPRRYTILTRRTRTPTPGRQQY